MKLTLKVLKVLFSLGLIYASSYQFGKEVAELCIEAHEMKKQK